MSATTFLAVVFLAAQVAVSEDDNGTTVDVHAGPVHVHTDSDGDDDDHQYDHNQSHHRARLGSEVLRISQLLGTSVVNGDDETIGAIEDVAVDPRSGGIRYAAVSAGGFLGIGDKLIAVPWHAFRWEIQKDDSRVAVLNIDKKALADIEGFDDDHWPNMADPHWQKRNDRLFPILPRLRGEVDVD
jgi:sporulation protein YlmC with PRC-barrel domain